MRINLYCRTDIIRCSVTERITLRVKVATSFTTYWQVAYIPQLALVLLIESPVVGADVCSFDVEKGW